MITDQEYLTDEDKICLLPEQLGSQIVANSNSLKLDRIMDSLEQAESFIIPKVDPKEQGFHQYASKTEWIKYVIYSFP